MNRYNQQSLTQGNILKSLITFAVPVLLALFLQAMYGAAALIIVGQFADTYEQSGVASGSQLFNMITMVITGLTMGVTVFVGDRIGAGAAEKSGKRRGDGNCSFRRISRRHNGAGRSAERSAVRLYARAGSGVCTDGCVHPHLRHRFGVYYRV